MSLPTRDEFSKLSYWLDTPNGLLAAYDAMAAEIARLTEQWTALDAEHQKAERRIQELVAERDVRKTELTGLLDQVTAEWNAAERRIQELTAEHDALRGQRRKALQEADATQHENDELDAMVTRLTAKLKVEHMGCACEYDEDGDVCLMHTARLNALRAERDALREKLIDAEADLDLTEQARDKALLAERDLRARIERDLIGVARGSEQLVAAWDADIARITAERDALLLDKQRIDWLDAHPHAMDVVEDGTVLHREGVWWGVSAHKSHTFRAAVDAARAAPAEAST
jgi:hypothetical protein